MRAPSATEPRRADALLPLLPAAAVAAAVFAAAYANGSFAPSARAVIAIAVWWALGLCVALRLWPVSPPPRVAVVVGLLLAGYAALTLVSAAWSPSAGDAYAEFNQAALVAGVFAVGVAAVGRTRTGSVLDGIAAAIVLVAAVALVSRFFPGSFGSRGAVEFLPAWQVRLSFPLGYWNGLAVFCALAVPLLLRRAVADGHPLVRGLAVAPFPVLAAVVFLASSRGGVATVAVAALVFLVLAPPVWRSSVALGVAAVGSVAAVLVLHQRDALVNGPLELPVVDEQGRSAAALVLLLCLATGAAHAAVSSVRGRVEVPRGLRIAALAAAALAAVALLVAVDPIARFAEFREPPEVPRPVPGFVQRHLASTGGSGRWQFWSAAVDEWQEHPVAGGGAGSFESWWAQHGTLAVFARNAHSLYLETLGELGPVGFGLLVGALVVALTEGVRRARAGSPATGLSAAAVTALVAAFAFAAGIDWIWELSAVSAVAAFGLGLLVGPATAVSDLRPRAPAALGVAVVAAAWLVVCAQAIALLSQLELERSEAATRRGDAATALEHARSAEAIQPWAAAPHLQEALVEERLGRFARARRAIQQAIERDSRNWRLWLTQARIETRAGDIAAARRSLARARALNPRSPVVEAGRLG